MCVACSCVYTCKLPAQPPGLAAKPLLDQCRGPGWPSNSLSLMKNKPLNHRDCLQRRGKGTISGTLHPPREAGPKGGPSNGCTGRAGMAQPMYLCAPQSPGEGLVVDTTQGSPWGESPLPLSSSPCAGSLGAGLTPSVAGGPLPQVPHRPAPWSEWGLFARWPWGM